MKKILYCTLVASLLMACWNTNRGLVERVPASQTLAERQPVVNDSNCLVISLDSIGQIWVRGEVKDIKEVREIAKTFIQNKREKHVIYLYNHEHVGYVTYLNVQNELVAAYNELWDELAQVKYHMDYDELDEDSQRQIQKIYPQTIAESSPQY